MALAAILVEPVRRDARFRHRMHGRGANLELHRRTQRADQCRVQRLVAIRLRNRDVVLEAAGHRLVQLVQHAERPVTILQRLHDDAEAEDVVHLSEAGVFLLHLAVDGEHRFLAATERDAHLRVGEGLRHITLHAGHDVASVASRAAHGLVEGGMAPRRQVAERQLLQLAIELVQAQAMGDRGVDVQGLAGDAVALLDRHRRHRAHVVQTVGQLDEDDPHVPGHRHQHLAERFGLALLTGRELQLVQLGQPVDHLGRGRTESGDQLGLGDAAVLHGVVHQGRHHGLHVQVPVGHQPGHGDRVGDVGLATGAVLAEVRLVGKLVGFPDLADLALAQVAQLLLQGRERRDLDGGCLEGCRGRAHATLKRGRQQLDGKRADPHAQNLPPNGSSTAQEGHAGG